MDISAQEFLSVYRHVADIDEAHGVYVVQHVYSHRIFVLKKLNVYNRAVYDCLLNNPVPGLTGIYDLCEEQGILYVIEEYVDGETLEKILSEQGTLPAQEAARIGLELCKTLSALHEGNPPIIHRDIKPANIIISRTGNVKLLDMNAAHFYAPSSPTDTQLLGTMGYAAPEQYGFSQSGPTADIYSLGVLMNVMITGNTPNVFTVPGSMGSIISRCTEMTPGRRFQSARELASSLRQCVESYEGAAGESYKAPRTWQKYLPVGFRSLNPGCMLSALAAYILMFDVIISMGEPMAGVALFIIAQFTGNYLNVQSYLPLTRSKYKLLQMLGILLYDFIIILFAVLLS